MDAGGLAQMTFNNFQSQGALGGPTSSFGSRGKGAALKRLSVASPPKVASIAEDSVATPRTSRSHLLAGLRTAPKTPTSAQPPASAPYNQRQHNIGGSNTNNNSRFARQAYNGGNQGVPQTAIGSGFTGVNQYSQPQQQQQQQQPQSAMYDQVLAPPSLQYDDGEMDPNVAAQLLATEMYLAQRQQQLQQQLLALTAQQFGNMNLNVGNRQSQQFPQYAAQMNAYGQQFQSNPLIQETNQPGVYLTFNQLTGQYQYVVDPSYQQEEFQPQMAMNNLSHSPPPPTPGFTASPPKVDTPVLHVSPPNEINPSPWGSRSTSPPKKSNTPPQDVVPLPPPSANAFRRGHKKNLSSLAIDGKTEDGPRSALARPVGFPATPMTGTFGPGQARAGEHPVRQPRNPPSIEELKERPTTKHEGSKNFATRQRRQAIGNLVRAGIGRRSNRTGSGSASPDSEHFPSSDNDSDSVRSGSSSLSGKPSIGSLRAAANGAIGSERKASKERSREGSLNRSYTANSVSSDGGASVGGGLVEIRPEETWGERRTMPKLVLTSAEKRKSTMF